MLKSFNFFHHQRYFYIAYPGSASASGIRIWNADSGCGSRRPKSCGFMRMRIRNTDCVSYILTFCGHQFLLGALAASWAQIPTAFHILFISSPKKNSWSRDTAINLKKLQDAYANRAENIIDCWPVNFWVDGTSSVRLFLLCLNCHGGQSF